jgi:hypothetical protein
LISLIEQSSDEEYARLKAPLEQALLGFVDANLVGVGDNPL